MARDPQEPEDDLLHGPVPAPDADATPSERAHARSFAELVDKTIAGRTPAAMTSDDRALLEVATVIRATAGGVELAPARQRALVEDALRQAIGGGSSARTTVIPIAASRAKRWAPWMVASASTAVAIAALLMLWLRPARHLTPALPSGAAARSATAAMRMPMPMTWRSRPSDPLIGPIAAEHAGDASARLDYIFADRLDGYRERRFAAGGSR